MHGELVNPLSILQFAIHTCAPVNSVAVLLEASRDASRSASIPVVLADAGVENVNAQVDTLIDTASCAVCSRSRT